MSKIKFSKPELIESWKRNVRNYTLPFALKDGKMIIPHNWDKIKDKYDEEHIFVMFEHQGRNISRDMALWTDDNIRGLFSYRDWTKSTLPFVDDDEIYWSGFTFQYLKDAKSFVDKFGGNGNWMEGHKEFVKKCNENRNS